MNSVANYSRSINETHRICTHDISGHLHLLRFCMDEINENKGEASKELLSRLDEGLEKLEDLNKLLKVCTRYFDPNVKLNSESIAEKAFGLVSLYHHKFLGNISCEVSGVEYFELEKGTTIIEAIFGVSSTLCHFAAIQDLGDVNIKVSFKDQEVLLSTAIPNIEHQEINKLLKNGNENDKTLRRAYAHELVEQCGGEIIYESDPSQTSVRIRV